MLWILRRSGSDRRPYSQDEKRAAVSYLEETGAIKYAPSPARPTEIYFLAEYAQHPVPHSFQVLSDDPSYMPLAYDGIEYEWKEKTLWFFELSRDIKTVEPAALD